MTGESVSGIPLKLRSAEICHERVPKLSIPPGEFNRNYGKSAINDNLAKGMVIAFSESIFRHALFSQNHLKYLNESEFRSKPQRPSAAGKNRGSDKDRQHAAVHDPMTREMKKNLNALKNVHFFERGDANEVLGV